jgi:hypothetical protein
MSESGESRTTPASSRPFVVAYKVWVSRWLHVWSDDAESEVAECIFGSTAHNEASDVRALSLKDPEALSLQKRGYLDNQGFGLRLKGPHKPR